MEITNWDNLAEIFDTSEEEKAHYGAMDNVLIAWPEILKIIDSYKKENDIKSILDFGCGTGSFCNLLSEKGYDCLGIDPSISMIEIAKKSRKGNFISEEIENLDLNKKFDAIVSIMVFQFLENFEETLSVLYKHLNKGLIIFAVHNPAYVNNCFELGLKYTKKENKTFINFKDKGAIEIFIREKDYYTEAFKKIGMKEYISSTPEFTQEYIDKFRSLSKEPTDIPKFLIMSFVK